VIRKVKSEGGTSKVMTKTISFSCVPVLVLALSLLACGSDPFVGTTSSTYTSTNTGSPTVTTTATATGNPTQTDTSSLTDTGPLTATATTTATMTGSQTTTGTGTPDGGVDAAPTDSSYAEFNVLLAPNRLLDLVVMIDNSPSMAPKVAKLNAQFPRLLNALKDPSDGTLPDLRVAVIDSDLGTGGAYSSGSCGPKTLPDGTSSVFGDLGRFQMLKTPSGCTFYDGAEFLEYKTGQPINYTGDISTVFACLAGNLGTLGCGEEHQLQAFEFALAARGIGNEQQQRDFLRANAYLGLVFLTDEDDCSAAVNDGLFGDKPELRGESASLRCATRGHVCGGRNLADAPPPGYPTAGSFATAFGNCQARTDTCPNTTDGYADGTDTSGPTDCAPLKNVKNLAEEMKALKAVPESQILVAGIFGWPLTDAEMATAQYKIAPVPNPNTADTMHPTVYDYWPVCYDPDHLPSAATTDPATGFDVTAAGWGATGGLRESAFVDEFGANGMKFSICQRDFSNAMSTIGATIARKVQNLCVDQKLFDSNLTQAGVQPECRVAFRTPQVDPHDPTQVIYVDATDPLPACPAGATKGNVAADCWQLGTDTVRCPVLGQLVTLLRTAAEVAAGPLSPGTQIHMQCHICVAGATDPGCAY
jgi:hypothetical protein